MASHTCIGLSFAFGSTPASIAFAEATMTAGGK